MLKKVLLVSLVAMFCSFGFAAKKTGIDLGIGDTMVGLSSYNSRGQLEGMVGLNWGFGITFKRYFEPVKYKAWNAFWHAGTIVLILPFVGIGADYFFDDTVYAGIDTYWIIPSIHLNFAI